MAKLGGCIGKILRVDLSEERLTEETPDEATLRQYLGGTGLGIKIMYDEVPAGVEWSDPANRIIWTAGVLAGTRAPGSGQYAVATKGPLTNLFSAAHANGFFGARLKFAGYDTVIVQGAAKRWLYLYIHDGVAELRDAAHLLGKDTWETQELLTQEVGDRQASVSCIGPAGENLVKYACVCSDRGHVASTNGCGAVMGSKKLKAIVVHGKAAVPIHNKTRFDALLQDWWKENDESIWGFLIPSMGTSGQLTASASMGMAPVKNLTEYDWPEQDRFNGDALREYYNGKPHPCYACRWGHCHHIEIKSGPHKGEIVEEAEYEGTQAFSCQIGNMTDVDAVEWLNHVNDGLGMDLKEQAWVLGMAMECYNKGLITKKDTDGLDLTWGNVEAVEILLDKIARRDGFGDVLAEGVMRAAQKIGGDAPNFAVYTHKGNGPHAMDPRALWSISFGMAISDMGSGYASDMGDQGDLMGELGDVNVLDPDNAFSAEIVAKAQAIMSRRGHFIDSLGVCMFLSGVAWDTVADTVSAATGWDFDWREAADVGARILNLMRAFNVRHGHTREHNSVSPRIQEPPLGGPAEGISVGEKWDEMVDIYYETRGWDREGRPLPGTLTALGLDDVARELWA
jgi:aldehyde:ferredoxin oxidoreductase